MPSDVSQNHLDGCKQLHAPCSSHLGRHILIIRVPRLQRLAYEEPIEAGPLPKLMDNPTATASREVRDAAE